MDHDADLPSATTAVTKPNIIRRLWHAFYHQLNFFRIHLLFFTFTPLIFSGIFVGVNGKYTINYIDSLFNCVSALCVNGLATINLSELTALQQALLFVQMCVGSPIVVAWLTVYIRRSFFESELQHIIERKRGSPSPSDAMTVPGVPWHLRLKRLFRLQRSNGSRTFGGSIDSRGSNQDRGSRKLNAGMIRRLVDDRPKLVNPMGWISEGGEPKVQTQLPPEKESIMPEPDIQTATPIDDYRNSEDSASNEKCIPLVTQEVTESPQSQPQDLLDLSDTDTPKQQNSNSSGMNAHFQEPSLPSRSHTAQNPSSHFPSAHSTRSRKLSNGATGAKIPRTRTIEFALPQRDGHRRHASMDGRPRLNSNLYSDGDFRRRLPRSPDGPPHPHIPMSQTSTMHSNHGSQHTGVKHLGYGGFPGPQYIISKAVGTLFPRLQKQLTRTMTIPQHNTTNAPYVSFDAVVGHNSAFQMLTVEDLDELGGVEYRALNALLWIVGIYHIGSQLIAFTIICPVYFNIEMGECIRTTRTSSEGVSSLASLDLWFSLFQVISAYTNTGMSLVDQSMIPFQKAYPMIFSLFIIILAGNTAFPVFLRLFVWIISKCLPARSRLKETIHFLLDHPRRCFLYLFPSHQTWFLVTVLVLLNCTDWFFYLVLDIGNPVIEAVPVGTRIALGLLQASAVRSAGFATVPLSALAPAVRVLYVIMMYVSVYPIAMSVRATNVYEEKSLGIYGIGGDDSMDEPSPGQDESRRAVWGKYLSWHIRKQLSFDMWWLAVALFLICIVERDNLTDASKADWFNIFTILFELVSAYGTVGLSLGVPYDNFSFSGALRPLSKLILCLVMIRGRHRGLPAAIDRAILVPQEFKNAFGDDSLNVGRTRTVTRDESPGQPRVPESSRVESL